MQGQSFPEQEVQELKGEEVSSGRKGSQKK